MRSAAWMLALVLIGTPTASVADDADGGAEVSDRCAPPHDLKPELADAYSSACAFFGGVADRDLAEVTPYLHAPFYFEGKEVTGSDEVTRRWKQLLADVGAPATFYSLEVLSYDDMVKKHGKPPAKLENVPMHSAVIAVANLDGRAEIAALKRDNGHWAVFAFHD